MNVNHRASACHQCATRDQRIEQNHELDKLKNFPLFPQLETIFERTQYMTETRWAVIRDELLVQPELSDIKNYSALKRRVVWRQFLWKQLQQLPPQMAQVQRLFEQTPNLNEVQLAEWCCELQLPTREVRRNLLWLKEQANVEIINVEVNEEDAPIAAPTQAAPGFPVMLTAPDVQISPVAAPQAVLPVAPSAASPTLPTATSISQIPPDATSAPPDVPAAQNSGTVSNSTAPVVAVAAGTFARNQKSQENEAAIMPSAEINNTQPKPIVPVNVDNSISPTNDVAGDSGSAPQVSTIAIATQNTSTIPHDFSDSPARSALAEWKRFLRAPKQPHHIERVPTPPPMVSPPAPRGRTSDDEDDSDTDVDPEAEDPEAPASTSEGRRGRLIHGGHGGNGRRGAHRGRGRFARATPASSTRRSACSGGLVTKDTSVATTTTTDLRRGRSSGVTEHYSIPPKINPAWKKVGTFHADRDTTEFSETSAPVETEDRPPAPPTQVLPNGKSRRSRDAERVTSADANDSDSSDNDNDDNNDKDINYPGQGGREGNGRYVSGNSGSAGRIAKRAPNRLANAARDSFGRVLPKNTVPARALATPEKAPNRGVKRRGQENPLTSAKKIKKTH